MTMKDKKITTAIDSYLSGSERPDISLARAKLVIRERNEKKRKRKMMAFSLTALTACLALMFYFNSFPGLGSPAQSSPSYYEMSALSRRSVAYATLRDSAEYSVIAASVARAGRLPSAEAQYYARCDGEEIKLIEIEIFAVTTGGSEKCTVYVELPGNETCKDFLPYYDLESTVVVGGVKCLYNSERVAGEWESTAFVDTARAKYFIQLQSPNSGALANYLEICLGK